MKEKKKRGKFKIISNMYMKRTLKRQKYPHHPPENIIFDFFPHFFFYLQFLANYDNDYSRFNKFYGAK